MKRTFTHKNYVRGTEELSYLASIRKYTPMTPEEERKAFEEYRNGNIRVKEDIIKSNLLYVYSVASSLAENASNVMDYNNSGVTGLMEAVDKFDPSKGVRFYTYASFYIVRNMYAFKYRENPSVVQSNHAKIAAKAYALSSKFYQEEERDPSREELAELFEEQGIDVKDMRDLDELYMCSADDECGEDSTFAESPEFSSRTRSENGYLNTVENDDRNMRLGIALTYLKERDREIMEYLLGIKTGYAVSEEEVAMRMDLTVTRVQQIRNESVKKLHDIVYTLAV